MFSDEQSTRFLSSSRVDIAECQDIFTKARDDDKADLNPDGTAGERPNVITGYSRGLRHDA